MDSFISWLFKKAESLKQSLLSQYEEQSEDPDFIYNFRKHVKRTFELWIDRVVPLNRLVDRRFIVLVENRKNYDNVRCPICMLVFYKPVITNCGHTFCHECLRKSVDKYACCPMCREPIAPDSSLSEINAEVLGSEYSSIKIRCSVCRDVMTIKDYDPHLVNKCYSNRMKYRELMLQSIDNDITNKTKTNAHLKKLKNVFGKQFDINQMKELKRLLKKSTFDHIRHFSLVYAKSMKEEHIVSKEEINEVLLMNAFLICKLSCQNEKPKSSDTTSENRNASQRNNEEISQRQDDFDSANNARLRDSALDLTTSNRDDSTNATTTNNTTTAPNNRKKKFQKTFRYEHFEMLRDKFVRKNKINNSIYILFECTDGHVNISLHQNYPTIPNKESLQVTKLEAYKFTKKIKYREEFTKVEHLLKIMKKRCNLVYDKVFNNSIHIFNLVLFYHIQKKVVRKLKEYHFKNEYISNYELMLHLLYLKYEQVLPQPISPHLLLSKEFLTKVLESGRTNELSREVFFVSNLLTLKKDIKVDEIALSNNDSVEEKPVHVIITIEKGIREVMEESDHPLVNNTEHKYSETRVVCYLIILYSTKGFAWLIKENLHFLQKKEYITKNTKVFFTIDKLIEFFLKIKNEKYNAQFWNINSFLNSMRDFCTLQQEGHQIS